MPDTFRDIIPPERRSIRNITPSPRRSKRPQPETPIHEERDQDEPPKKPWWGFSLQFSRFGLWIVALVIVAVFALSFSLLFSGSKVMVTPKQRDVLIDGTFQTSLETAGTLGYELMSIERVLSRTIPATGEEEAEERATGQIIIYNDFDSNEQRLITNTRFESPDGLVYRINEPVVVPGQQEVGGKTVPGSIEVTVYADEPGEAYNIGLTDFDIPGFRGGPRFEKFYARSRTPMTGGFVGARLTVEESAVEEARVELREELESTLLSEGATQVPVDFHLFDDATFIRFESLPNIDKDGEAEVREKAILYGVLFNKEELAKFVAQNTVAGFEEAALEITDFSTLAFSVIEKDAVRPWEDGTVSFMLTGTAHLVWIFDEVRFKEDLAGRAKDALPTILSGYTSIEQARIVLRPFWKRSLPKNPDKITIERIINK